MAVFSVRRLVFWMTFCGSVLLCVASPTRRQFGSLTETTSSDPAAAVTDGGAVWDDTDDFDLDGDKDWLSEVVISPSSIPQQSDYEDYDDDDDDDDYAPRRANNALDLGDDDDDDVEHQDAEEGNSANQAEFLFVPSKDNRFMLQDDDDDQSGPIKVRHTGKNSYTEVLGSENSEEDTSDSNRQFEFTIDNGGEDDDKENEVDDDTGDFVLDDAPHKDSSSNNVEVMPRQELHEDDNDDEDGDDNFVADGDTNGDPMFESPEEDSQVIYGDHVFMY